MTYSALLDTLERLAQRARDAERAIETGEARNGRTALKAIADEASDVARHGRQTIAERRQAAHRTAA